MDGKLGPGIQLPPPLLETFTPLFQGKPLPPLIQKFFNPPPFLKFWLESQTPSLKKRGGTRYDYTYTQAHF